MVELAIAIMGSNMRALVTFFCAIAAIGVLLVPELDRITSKSERSLAKPASAMSAAVVQPQTTSGYRTVTLQPDRSGHYRVKAQVDGSPVEFMVDTGASAIVLRETEASHLGIHPFISDYTVKTQTANGIGKAARVQLKRIDLDGITADDVDALVVPDDSLSVNLLGMSFLSRVKWTHDQGRLVLEQ